MAGTLPPPPIRAEPGSFPWLDWYSKLFAYTAGTGTIPWASIDKTGSKLSDLQFRDHSMLTSVQGGGPGEEYHLTFAQWSFINSFGGQHNNLLGLQGGTTSQYYHLTLAQQTLVVNWDHQSLNNLQGGISTERYHLTNAQNTLVANWLHNSLNSIQGGNSTERYHLTSAQNTLVVNWTHNSLNSIQGGAVGDYQHLTSAQVTSFTAAAATRSNVIATNTSALSLANNAFTVVSGNTTTLNTGSNFNAATGVYTVPVSGTYDIRCAFSLTAAVFPAGTIAAIAVQVNGTNIQQTTDNTDANVNVAKRPFGAFRVNCTAGDTITLAIFQNSGGAVTLDGNSVRNFLSIRQD